MATYTNNLKLVKPSLEDDVDIEVINRNFDMIDEALANIDPVLSEKTLQENLKYSKLEGTPKQYIIESMEIQGGNPKTTFFLSATPDDEPVTAYINGFTYLENIDFIVSRTNNNSVKWINDLFKITDNLTTSVHFKYRPK